MDKSVTCIVCPKSCQVRLGKGDEVVNRHELGCAKGREYAVREGKDPRRVFTSTVKVQNGEFKRAPVRSSKPIRKEDWQKAADATQNICLKAPVRLHSVVIKGFLEEGIDLVTTREIIKQSGH